MRWSDDENDMPLAKRTAGNMWTPWLYLALDFRAATGLELARTGEKEEETKVTTMGRYFASASRCMALRCGTKLRKNIEEHLAVATMAPIGVKHVGGIKGRALLLRPQRVNTALYELGMSIKEGTTSANTLNSYIKMPNFTRVLWAQSLPHMMVDRVTGYNAQELREKKKTTPEAAPAAVAVAGQTIVSSRIGGKEKRDNRK